MKPLVHIQDPTTAAAYYDKCIGNSPNGLVYALSWYMNIICPEWEILSTEDHTSVMPLPVVKSMNRKILRQPDFAWQLGIFSMKVPSPELVMHFLDSIPSSYRLRKLNLNKYNLLPAGKARLMNSAELDLIRSYRKLNASYGPSMKKKLEMAKQHSFTYVANVSVHDLLMFSYRLDKFNRNRLKPREISQLRMISTNAIRFRSGQIGAAYDQHNNLVGAVFFLIFRGRATILYAAASTEGIDTGAIEFIIDRFILSHAEQNMVLSVDNSGERKIMEILKTCGAGISNYPSVKNLR